LPQRPGSAPRLAVLALAWLVTAACPPAARSQSTAFPEELRSIAAVRFEGLRHLRRHQFADASLRTHGPSIFPWRDKPLLRRDYLRADSAAIVSVYRHYGYLDAAVSVSVAAGREAQSAIVTFHIREGALTRISRVELDSVTVFKPRDLLRTLNAQPGVPYDPSLPHFDTQKLQTAYLERGHLARMRPTVLRDDPDSTHVALRYVVEEGPEYRVGRIRYTPGLRVRESLGRRELLLKSGDLYQQTRLDLSVQHLYDTGLFRQVQVTKTGDTLLAGRMNLDLRVVDRPARWVDVGVGSGTTNRYQATGQVGHRNIDTRALGIVLDGQVARDGQDHPSREAGTVTLSEPWFLGLRLLAQTSGFYVNAWDRADSRFVVHEKGPGFNLSLQRELSPTQRVTLVQENLFVEQDYQILGELPQAVADSLRHAVLPSYTTHTLRLTLEHDLRDDKIVPHRGSYQVLSGELAGGPLKGTSYYRKGSFSSVWYHPMANGWTFAARAMGGVMRPFGNVPDNFSPDVADSEVARVPRDARFFIGGVNSLRGYAENSLPASGGLAMLLFNAEWRIPVRGPLGVEVFVDAGNVWDRPEYMRLGDFIAPWNANHVNAGDLRYSYGAGGRLMLPFGPLRFDLAWSPSPDFPRGHIPFVYQFAIGPSF